ncbi:histidine phosphatase family protein [Flavobacterium sp. xlx-214]|uniref:SixA phosphatase family protein n=1 Tax=unclassified Flavobacterium TaxID=196869 RepID=UPI0013D732F4|nr:MULTISPECIES: histidine phosphatase family protein [unclassified Flavobacterium]MBA5793526.1 histidine phosphatase family protein [Flavobacterium sp. xlx-221]QMI82704.1 histidine phosphatase family protein [Flavobacterium sp. xlx-214]
MKKLILVRHGKSSWEMPLEDHERPLTNKGISNSNKIFESITQNLPDRFLIWSSTAKRAHDTAKIFNEAFNIPQELTILKPELYTFDASNLTKLIRNCEDTVPNLIIFGHNNAITDFVNTFGNKYIENVPTSGVVVLEFDDEQWSTIQKGNVTKTLFPKDLNNAIRT